MTADMTAAGVTADPAGDPIRDCAVRVLDACRRRGLKVATAESCTGGLVSGALTEIPGSSDVVDRGFVTYSNAAKQAMLGVPAEVLERHGAVSRETAYAMAAGALAMSGADLAVAITGIAGPGGGCAEKPVGLVHFAAAARRGRHILREKRFGDIGRSTVRARSVAEALAMLEELATEA
jgi:nicotinamide-nucleotide amidase